MPPHTRLDDPDAPPRRGCLPVHVRGRVAVSLAALVVALFAVVIFTLASKPGGGDESFADLKECEGVACGRRGAVATTQEHATEVGLSILKRGGNAVDAAVAVQLALNVVQPQSTGIGGGCFVMVYRADTGEVHALDGREEFPALATPNMFCRDSACAANASCAACPGGEALPFDERVTGGHAVGVPGTFAAVTRVLDDHGSGRFTLAELAAPAVRLARDGFPMYAHLREKLENNRERLLRFPASAELFLTAGGRQPPALGEVWRNPDLADTLELLGAAGRDGFYSEGGVGADAVAAARDATNPATRREATIRVSDVTGYRAVYREPVRSTYRNRTVYGMAPSSGGGLTVALALNMLELFELADMRAESAELLHRLVDAQDAAFADRDTYLADADWVNVSRDALLDKRYASERVDGLMRASRAAGAPLAAGCPDCDRLAAAPQLPRHGTTHFSVADRDGNWVAWTTTIEENLGSAVVVPGRGFLLNNELTDATGVASDPATGLPYANRPEGGKRPRRTAVGAGDAASAGGKRPMSSMSPTMVMGEDGEPLLALGSPGGSRIIGTVLNAVVGALDLGLGLRGATDMPRVVSRNNYALAEPAFFEADGTTPGAALRVLQARGFDVRRYETPRPSGYVQSVMRVADGVLAAAADTARLETAGALAF